MNLSRPSVGATPNTGVNFDTEVADTDSDTSTTGTTATGGVGHRAKLAGDGTDSTVNYAKFTGVTAGATGATPGDEAAGRVFAEAGLPQPSSGQLTQAQDQVSSSTALQTLQQQLIAYANDASTTNKQALAAAANNALRQTPGVANPQLSAALTSYQNNPTAAQAQNLQTVGQNYLQSAVTPNGGNIRNAATTATPSAASSDTDDATQPGNQVDASGNPVQGQGTAVGPLSTNSPINVWALVFLAMRDSYNQDNKQKEYVLAKLEQYNVMSQGMNSYIQAIEAAQNNLDQQVTAGGQNSTDALNDRVPFDLKHFDDFSSLSNGQLRFQDNGTVDASSTDLNNYLKELESQQETLSNYRQQATNDYQDADQQANQAFGTLSDFVKNLGQMANIGTKNMPSM